MTTIGPFLIGAPLALFALLALPVIWWILRATPPAPKPVELPSMRLLEGIAQNEETPARTPWWVWLIRTLAAAAAIAGLSQPVYAPGASISEDANQGALLIVIDDGWPSVPRWAELINAATASLDGGGRDDPVHLLLTAPRELNADPAKRMRKSDMARRLSSLDPAAWGTDRNDALERLQAAKIAPTHIFWASDGIADDNAREFADALADMAPLCIYAAPPQGPVALTGIASDTDSVSVTLRRLDNGAEKAVYVSALTLDGSALATAEADFAPGTFEAQARFDLPGAALARISRFTATGKQGAGTVWLWDSTERSRRVGLVSIGSVAQPLLSDLHYVRKALEPFASITEGDLDLLLDASPDAIIMTDVGHILPDEQAKLSAWIEGGGALIRFAGPRLAAQGDELLPVPLRRSSRALGGSLAWDEPQALAQFPERSPFAGLKIPEDVRIRKQVLAKPAADLAERTWAMLEDGSPLVTAEARGAGTIILFHITAGPEWSDLPYSGTFAQMLRRSIAAGRGEALPDEDGAYTPQLTLDAYGRLQSASPSAAPLLATEFDETIPSESHPPGLYQGPAGTRALNVAKDARPSLMTRWPPSAQLLGDTEARSLRLAGPLLTLAALLLALDLFIALGVAGHLSRFRRHAAALVLISGLIVFSITQTASAQDQYQRMPDGSLRLITTDSDDPPLDSKAAQAALDMRFAYVETGQGRLDERTRAGLIGLSRILFMRTSVEPAEPHGVDLETDTLEVYPLIYYNVPDNAQPLSETAITRLNTYLRSGGALLIDTRAGGTVGTNTDVSELQTLLSGLDAPPLEPVPSDHVLTRSFYLLEDFPGRFANRRLWIEASGEAETVRGDGISRLFVGDADWASAWASDDRGRDLYSVDGGPRQREMSRRFGVNLVMYILTGNYKSDQVHLPALLERLGEAEEDNTPEEDVLPSGSIMDGGPQ